MNGFPTAPTLSAPGDAVGTTTGDGQRTRGTEVAAGRRRAPGRRQETLLLVIDPDPAAATLAEELGPHVDVQLCGTAAEGLLVAGSVGPDVVLVVADPGDIAARTVVALLDRRCGIPVVVAADGGQGALAGAALDAGAVACVPYPYRSAQLLALLRAVRAPDPAEDRVLRCGALELDADAQTVHLRGTPIQLPPREFLLLHFLMTRPGRVVSQAQLRAAVWGESDRSGSNTVSVHVGRLRRRLGDDHRAVRIITTVGRSGYRLQAPADDRSP